MKKILLFILLLSGFSFTSCEVFEIDNYQEPGETIHGAVVDEATGDSILTDQGSEGIRVRMTQLDYSDNADHNPDFFCMPNGSFQNTKVFKGYYNVRVDGPFVPIIRENEEGTPIVDGSQTVKVEGSTECIFKVKPFLKVEFVGYPTVSNGQITLADVCQHPLQVLFREVAIVLYLEGSTWKILDEMGRSEQMTEGMKLFDIISFAKCVLYSGLQNRCIWFV